MLSEEAMLTLEANIPKLACNAFEKAYYDALTNSGRVLRAINGQLVETTAEGLDRVIRDLPARTVVKVGTRLVRKVRPESG